MRILLIEDEKDVAYAIKDTLDKHYIVDVSFTGKTGSYKAYIKDYDLIIIDYVLPDIDGVEVCRQLRMEGMSSPILFLTGRYTIREKTTALNAGADDYLTKPFSSKELIARIRALMRRHVGHYQHDVITYDSLRIDTIQRTVLRDEKNIKLRKKAFDLLEYMLRNKERVLTRGMIFEHVWENAQDEMSNTVDVHIKYLRDKIDKPYGSRLIKTVHGLGYKISADKD